MTLSHELRYEYNTLFSNCQIQPLKRPGAMLLAWKIGQQRARYERVSRETGVPWYLIAALHSLECSLNFGQHLHNGDPLTARTKHVPKGRPPGPPPFSWEESATDALIYDGLAKWHDWSLAGCLYQAEGYNGWGYRKHGVRSPYLWGGSNHQQPGKYVADGVWDSQAQTKQIGVGSILHVLQYKGLITLG